MTTISVLTRPGSMASILSSAALIASSNAMVSDSARAAFVPCRAWSMRPPSTIRKKPLLFFDRMSMVLPVICARLGSLVASRSSSYDMWPCAKAKSYSPRTLVPAVVGSELKVDRSFTKL